MSDPAASGRPPLLLGGQGAPAEHKSILDRATPTASTPPPLSATQAQVDHLVTHFTAEATNWKSLAPMVIGGLVYRSTRLGLLSSSKNLPLAVQQIPGLIRIPSSVIALGAEAAAFEVSHRGIVTATADPSQPTADLWKWNGKQGLKTGWLNSVVTFGALKGGGKLAYGQNLILQHASQDAAMVFGHGLSYRLGIGQKPEGTLAEQFLHAEATNLQLGAGTALGHFLTGGRLASLERGLDLSQEAKEKDFKDLSIFKIPDGLDPSLVLAVGELQGLESKSDPLMKDRATEASRAAKDHRLLSEALRPEEGGAPRPVEPIVDEGKSAATSKDEVRNDPPAAPQQDPIEAPRFLQQRHLDETTLEKMEAFPAKVKKAAEGEANPVFFGLNIVKWWISLIKRDAGEWGADAIVEGGKILFGRFQESGEAQKRVAEDLQRIADRAVLTESWKAPSFKEFWRPLWDQTLEGLKDPADGGDGPRTPLTRKGRSAYLAAILQQVAKSSPEAAERWFQELAEKDVDLSVGVQEMMEGKDVEFPSAFDGAFGAEIVSLKESAEKDDWKQVNQKLEELYLQAMNISEPSDRFVLLKALEGAVVDLKGAAETRTPVRRPLFASAVEERLLALIHGIAEAPTPSLNPHQQLAYQAWISVALGLVYHRMGFDRKAEARFKSAWKKLNQLQTERGPEAVEPLWKIYEVFQHGAWEMSPQEAESTRVQEAEEKLQNGDWEGAFDHAEVQPQPLKKAFVLAHLIKRMVDGVRESERAAQKQDLVGLRLFGGFRVQVIELAKKMGQEGQGLMMSYGNQGADPARAWAYLAFALGILGETELASGYFVEADEALQEPVMNHNHGLNLANAAAKVEALKRGEWDSAEDLPPQFAPVLNRAVELSRKGQIQQAWQLIDTVPTVLEKAQALAHVARVIKTVSETGEEFLDGFPQEWIEAFDKHLQKIITPPNHAQNMEIAEAFLNTAIRAYVLERLGDKMRAEDLWAQYDQGVNIPQMMERFGTHWAIQTANRMKEGTWKLDPFRKQGAVGNAETMIRMGNVATGLNLLMNLHDKTEYGLALAHLADALVEEMAKKQAQGGVPLPPGSVPATPGVTLKIGREPDNDIILTSDTVSRHHAEIRLSPDGFLVLKDLSSGNGTHVEGIRLNPGMNYSLSSTAQVIYIGPIGVKIDFARPLPPGHVAAFVPEGASFSLKAFALPPAPAPQPKPVAALSPEAMDSLRRARVDAFESLPRREIDTIPMEYRHLIPEPKNIVLFPRFRRILNETASLMSAPARIAIRYFGPPGTFKTTIPEMIANKMGVPLFRVPFSRRTDPKDMEGTWTLEEVEGELVPVFQGAAPRIALEHGFHLVLDEPDLARSGTLASINNVSAPGRYAWVRRPDGELEKIEVHKGARIYATENGVKEVGREEHGKDFLRRFVPFFIEPPSEEEVRTIISEIYENYEGQRRWNRKVTQLLAHFHDVMRQLGEGWIDPDTRQALPPLGNGVGQKVEFTPRSFLRLAQRLVASGPLTSENLSRAIRAEYILPLADPKDQQMVWEAQAKPIFAQLGIPVGPEYIPDPTMESISQKYLGGRAFPEGEFTWTDQALRVADEMLWNKSLGIDVFLIGEAGEGKTDLPPQIAALLRIAYLQKTASSQMDEKDLVGGPGRKNGKYGHVPDVVYYGTKDGGLIHIDEFLLAETGKLESVFSPLMDGTRALIMTKPRYRMIKRHDDTFIVLTSNPPFGEYGDRYEHSGAAMSRVAVIFLTGGFAMQPKDRHQIMKAEMERPLEEGRNDEAKKKDLRFKFPSSAEGIPEGDFPIKTPSFSDQAPKEGDPERKLVFLHPLNGHALRHAVRLSVEPEKTEEDPKKLPIPIHPEIRAKFNLPEELIFDLEKIQVLQKREDGSEVELGSETTQGLKGFANYLTRRTQIEMAPLTDKKVFKISYAFGGPHATSLAKKEIRLNLEHLLTIPLLASLGVGKHEYAHAVIDRGSEKYDSHEPGRLFANVVGDPRMNEYAGSLRADFAAQIKVLNDLVWPEDWPSDAVERWKKRLPHEQFADAVIYFWRFGKSIPHIDNQKVIDALEKALPILKPAFTLFPQSTSDRHVDQAAKKFYQILDEAYPYYKDLIDESLQEVMERLEKGESPEDLMVPPMIFKIEIRRPPNGASQAQGAAGEGPVNQGQGEGKQAGAEKPQASPLQATMKGLGGDLFPKGKVANEPPAAVPPSPQMGDMGDISKPEGRLKAAKIIVNVRAGTLADQFEPRDPEAFENRKKEIAKAQAKSFSDGVEDSPSSSQFSSEFNQPMAEEEKKKIEEARRRALEKALENDLFRRMVPPGAIQAAKKLKKVIPPDDPTILDGHFDQGAEFDMEHWIEDRLSPMPTGKAMLRYVRPGQREANVVEVSDVSTSVVLAGAKDNAVKSSAVGIYLSGELKMNYGVIVFKKTYKIIKPLGKAPGTYQKKNDLLSAKQKAFDDPELEAGTSIRAPLDAAIQMIKKRKGRSNYIVLQTDGEEMANYHKSWDELLAEAKKENIHIMVLAMGDAKRYIPSIFKNDASHYRFVADDGSDIPDKYIELFEEAHKKRL